MAETLTLSEQKHLDILEAAKAAFLERGFDNVSMDVIADRASVSKRTVYNHFESKEALFEAITEQLVNCFKGGLRVDYKADTPLDEQLRHIIEAQVSLSTNEGIVATIRMLMAGMFTSPDSCRDAMTSAPEKHDPLIDWVQAALGDGRLVQCDPAIAAQLFRSMLEGVFFWPGIIGHHDVPSGARRDAVINDAVNMFLGFYAKPEAN